MGFELSLNHQGIVLSITGLNQLHFTQLIGEFISVYLTNIEQHIYAHLALSKAVLKNILISLQKTYKNLNYGHVWTQAYFAMYDVVKNPHFDRNLMLDIVQGLLAEFDLNAQSVFDDVLKYVDDVLSNAFLIEAFVHGNIYKKHAVNIMSKIRLSGISICRKCELIKMEHLKLQMNGYHKFVYQGFNSNEKDTNDVVQIWYQFNSNSRSAAHYIETCKVLLLARMMKSECFKQLRTKESLGYVATTFSKSSVGATNNINYLVLMVASGHKSAHYLNERVFNFVNEHYLNNILLKMNKKKFAMFVNGTINDLKQKYLRLSEETSLIWDEIIGHTYFFKWKAKYVEILKKITLNDMIRFYKHHIIGNEAKWISIQLFNQKKQKHQSLGHAIITSDESKDVLYFNETKDLQTLGYAEYFQVY